MNHKKMGLSRGTYTLARAPAFLYDWVGLFIIRPTMFAIMVLALGTYAVKPFYPNCDSPVIVVKMVTACAMCEFCNDILMVEGGEGQNTDALLMTCGSPVIVVKSVTSSAMCEF